MSRPVSRAPDRLSQEITILRALRAATDPRARQRLQGELLRVGEWRPQIKALARRWACDAIEPEEFESAGVMGLLEAAQRYDGGDGQGWPTYATQWIRRRMQELARAQDGPVVIETQWEQRTARRQRVARRAAAWSPIEAPGNVDAERGRYQEICAAAQEMQAAEEDQAAREGQRQRIRGALARMPPWARASLAPLIGEPAVGPVPVLEETRQILRRLALRRLRAELEG